MGGAGLVGVPGLGFGSLSSAEGRIHEYHVEKGRGTPEKPAVGLVAGQGVSVPDVGLVNAVQHQVGQDYGIDEILLLTPVEGPGAQLLQLVGGGRLAQLPLHVLIGLGQEAAGAAAWVVDGLPGFRGDGLHHGTDYLARREELAAVVVLLAHPQQQPLVGLGQQEHMGRVGGLVADAVDGVHYVQEVLLGVDADRLHRLHYLADHPLPRGCAAPPGEAVEHGEQVAVDKGKGGAQCTRLQLPALGAVRGGPVPPAIGVFQGRLEGCCNGGSLFRFQFLPLVQHPQEQQPSQLGNVLQGRGTVGPPHDVANGVYFGVNGRLGR